MKRFFHRDVSSMFVPCLCVRTCLCVCLIEFFRIFTLHARDVRYHFITNKWNFLFLLLFNTSSRWTVLISKDVLFRVDSLPFWSFDATAYMNDNTQWKRPIRANSFIRTLLYALTLLCHRFLFDKINRATANNNKEEETHAIETETNNNNNNNNISHKMDVYVTLNGSLIFLQLTFHRIQTNSSITVIDGVELIFGDGYGDGDNDDDDDNAGLADMSRYQTRKWCRKFPLLLQIRSVVGTPIRHTCIIDDVSVWMAFGQTVKRKPGSIMFCYHAFLPIFVIFPQ